MCPEARHCAQSGESEFKRPHLPYPLFPFKNNGNTILADTPAYSKIARNKGQSLPLPAAGIHENGRCVSSNRTPPGEAILSAAKEHAAGIRRTLWLRECKRNHCRAAPVRGRNRESWIIKGPIYSPEYWREWRNRCRSTKSRVVQDTVGRRQKQSRRPRATTHLRAESATARSLHTSSRNPVSTGIRLASSIPSPPSSSFAGGRPAKNIFAVPDTSALLRHHDAIVRPPLEGSPSGAARVTTCNGVRFSQSNPRPSLGIYQPAPDIRCDIERADRWVKPTAISYSFGTGRSTGAESPCQGISMENPSTVYYPIIRSPVRTVRLTPGDRFRSNASALGTPGPGAYTPKYDGVRYRVPGAVLWTRPETVVDPGCCKPASSWEGFGYGCSMKEHIDYGACLDGRCCMRHSVERKNASWVVQSQGKRCDQTRHLPSTRTRSSDEGQRATRSETEGQKGAVALCSYGSDGSLSSHPRSGRSISVSRRAVNTARVDQFGRKRAPLHFASKRNEVSVVDRLCRQGDDINAVDERGQTPLHIAAEKGNTRVVERLLRENEQDAELEGTPALTATEHPYRGGTAIVNAQDDNGRTPLYLGCLHGHERVVRALLMAGADPAMVDAQGKSPQASCFELLKLPVGVGATRGYRTAQHIPVATVQGGDPARRSKHCDTRRERATYGTSNTRGRFCEELLRPGEGQVGRAATDGRCKSSERGTSDVCRRKRRQQTAMHAAIHYDRLMRYNISCLKISTFFRRPDYVSF